MTKIREGKKGVEVRGGRLKGELKQTNMIIIFPR